MARKLSNSPLDAWQQLCANNMPDLWKHILRYLLAHPGTSSAKVTVDISIAQNMKLSAEYVEKQLHEMLAQELVSRSVGDMNWYCWTLTSSGWPVARHHSMETR